ncbi:MAG: hypothetical protein ACFE9A_21295, partial [Candidatus Hodarchaeota archaeon]
QGLQPAYNNLDTVPSSATTKGETWYFNITAFDGNDYSTEEQSPETTIINSAPEVNNLAITSNPTTIDNLVASWNDNDVDGDSLTYVLTWYLNGIEQLLLANKTLIESGNTTKGDLWTFTVELFDDTTSSLASLGYNITIINTPPYAGNLTLTSGIGTLDDLVADWDFSDADNDPRNDNLAHICWFKNGNNQTALTDQKYVNSTETVKNEVWWFTLRVHDGTTFSSLLYESEHVQILNTEPSNKTLLPIPVERTKADGLTLNLTDILNSFEDPDGDAIQIARIYWYKNTILQTDLNNSLTVLSNRLTKGEQWKYAIVPFDGSDYGLTYYSSEFTIQNSIPEIINCYFELQNAKTIDDLNIGYEASDADDESITVATIEWYRFNSTTFNWDHIIAYNGFLTLPFTATTKDETWKFRLQLTDGAALTDWEWAAIGLNIENSEPWIDLESISLVGGVNTSDSLQVAFSWYDDDPEDNSTGTIIVWENSGTYYNPTTDTSLDASNTKAGERWWVTIIPYDGTSWGASVNSKLYGINIIIGNSVPEIKQTDISIKGEFNGSEFSGGSYGTLFNLILYYNATDIDGDQGVTAFGLNLLNGYALGSEYRWYRNRSGTVTLISTLNDKTMAPWYETREGDTWWVQVRPRDLYGDFGIPKNSTPIAIGNTAPQIRDYLWIESSYFSPNDLSFAYTFFDYDTGDVEQGIDIQWYKNAIYLPVWDDETEIPSQNTTKGETWFVRIRVWDGEDYSDWYNLTDITILNSAPLANNVILLPSSPYTTEDLIANWNYTDADGDPQNVVEAVIEWYQNDILVVSLSNNQSVPASMTHRGERWYFEVRVTDGSDYSITYRSNSITIINTAPTLENVSFTNTNPNTTRPLEVDWTFLDLDGDTESTTVIIRWFKDGIYQSILDDLKSVSSGFTTKGEVWYYTVQVFDGESYSIEHSSLLITIANACPSIDDYSYEFNQTQSQVEPDVRNTLTERVFYVEGEPISISYEFVDDDLPLDADQSRIYWYY